MLALLWMPVAVFASHQVSTRTLSLEFSESGTLLKAAACYPSCETSAQLPGNSKRVQFGREEAGIVSPETDSADWSLETSREGMTDILKFVSSSGARITWRVPQQGYTLTLKLEGLSRDAGMTVRSGVSFRPRELAGFGGWLEQTRYVALEARGGEFDGAREPLDESVEEPWHSDGWAGYRNRYWALVARPSQPVSLSPQGGPGQLDAVISYQWDAKSLTFDFYLGPVEVKTLKEADQQLTDLMYGALWFWLRWICFALLVLLGVIHDGLAMLLPPEISWGVAIVCLSLAVSILMRPLTKLADRVQDNVHDTERRLAPQLEHIKRNHKGEQQAERILDLYKREGVHPLYSLKSLLGVAIVIPVFIGAFDMLAENIHLLEVSFLWIDDLSRPDALMTLPFEVPFFGAQLNFLPFLMTGLSMVSSSLHRSPAQHPQLRRRQTRNMFLLAFAFFVLFYTFPSGMVLYWTTNNFISAAKGGFRVFRAAPNQRETGDHE